MAQASISEAAIDAYVDRYASTSRRTPVDLPLSFPTPLHKLNVISTLNLLTSTLSHPRYRTYFTHTKTKPSDVGTRGVMGLYLSSSEEWDANNFLSALAWQKGEMSEAKVIEYFGISTMREEDHETLRGVRVGGRWAPGAELVEEIARLFSDLGDRLGSARCLGEVVKGAIDAAQEGRSSSDFVRAYCDQAVEFLPDLKDPYPTPTVPNVLPSTPLRLILDLSQLGGEGFGTTLPSVGEIADLSPLPLPILALTHLHILSVGDSTVQATSPSDEKQVNGNVAVESEASIASLSVEEYLKLMSRSVEVCQTVRDRCKAREGNVQGITMLDIAQDLESVADGLSNVA